jgi:hypothetical protein
MAIWDLDTGAELPFPPIGTVWHVLFNGNGDLITAGPIGIWRWPVQVDRATGEVRVGPARAVPLPPAGGNIAFDRDDQIMARTRGDRAEILESGKISRVGPLDDCRRLAISPDGQWLATGSHNMGAQVWSVRDKKRVADLPVSFASKVAFSSDGKWLMTCNSPSRLWTTGAWKLDRELGGHGLCFSPDSRIVVVLDSGLMIRLIEIETGRLVARLECPDDTDVAMGRFTPDASRLVLLQTDSARFHVWDLSAIGRRLSEAGLDWDVAATIPQDVSHARSPVPLRLVQVDLGALDREMERTSDPAETRVVQYSRWLEQHPDDARARHHRGHAFHLLKRYAEAIEDFETAMRLHPEDAHYSRELAAFRDEAARVLAAPPGELPVNVFAPAR